MSSRDAAVMAAIHSFEDVRDTHNSIPTTLPWPEIRQRYQDQMTEALTAAITAFQAAMAPEIRAAVREFAINEFLYGNNPMLPGRREQAEKLERALLALCGAGEEG